MAHMHATNITVLPETKVILELLKKNRDEHVEMVNEAQEGFEADVKLKLEAALAAAKHHGKKGITLRMTPPVSHKKDYDTVISMLEYHTGETIELTAIDMRRYGEDRWDWTDTFLRDNAGYSAIVRRKLAAAG
jgi:hypothetical protein